MADNRITTDIKNHSKLKFKVMAKTDFKTVEEYLKTQSKEAVSTLQDFRSSIKKLFPDLEEYINYQIPSFK